jgi:hypothetical protein
VLVHGEPPAAEALSVHLRERFNTRVTVAQKGDRFDLRQLRPVG